MCRMVVGGILYGLVLSKSDQKNCHRFSRRCSGSPDLTIVIIIRRRRRRRTVQIRRSVIIIIVYDDDGRRGGG